MNKYSKYARKLVGNSGSQKDEIPCGTAVGKYVNLYMLLIVLTSFYFNILIYFARMNNMTI